MEFIIWDLDNTLYQYPPDFSERCFSAAAQAAITLGVNISYKQALEAAKHSFNKYKLSYEIFSTEYGIDKNILNAQYHDNVNINFLTKCTETNNEFKKSSAKHSILTHGSTYWASQNVLPALGIKQHFNDNFIVGIEKVNYKKKNESKEPFEHMLNLFQCSAHQVTVIEDSIENLTIPKEMGMKTILITHGKNQKKDIFVDHYCQNSLLALKHLNQNHPR